ncbi:MAG: ThuA domain-containing protein, partial [Verrucomicrobia bacterium]|nr:ThuA domain-containing protein [Verrucomicrobiota bacterium]
MRAPLLACLTFLAAVTAPATPAKLRVLIIDGQNNHTVWPKSTAM